MSQHERNGLVTVIHLFRHGERGPLNLTYPNDPYKNYSYDPIKKEELTNKGKLEMYELGQNIRKRYQNFLSSSYSPKEYRIYTSEKERSIVSAQLYSAGLYPPTDTEIWNGTIKWNPIPTFMTEEPILRDFPAKFCPAYMRAFKPYTDKLLEEFKQDPSSKYISLNSGLDLNDYTQYGFLESALKSQNAFGLKLPEWAETCFSKMSFIMNYANVLVPTTEMKKLFLGCFLNEVIQHFEKMRSDPTSGQKLISYSGHDTNIMAILMTFGAFDQKLPPYGGGIFFELWKKDGEYYVNIYYQEEDIIPVTVEGNGFDCTFDKFKEFLSEYTISLKEFYKICY